MRRGPKTCKHYVPGGTSCLNGDLSYCHVCVNYKPIHFRAWLWNKLKQLQKKGGILMLSKDDFRKVQLLVEERNRIHTIWCEHCQKMVDSFWITQGHYLCGYCNNLLGFIMGPYPINCWNKEAKEILPVKYEKWEES